MTREQTDELMEWLVRGGIQVDDLVGMTVDKAGGIIAERLAVVGGPYFDAASGIDDVIAAIRHWVETKGVA